MVKKRSGSRGSGRLTEELHIRLTDDELEFIKMISDKTGLSASEAARLAINMFRVVLGLEAVDVEKVGRAIREAAEKAIRDAKEEGWYEDLLIEEAIDEWRRSRRSRGPSESEASPRSR